MIESFEVMMGKLFRSKDPDCLDICLLYSIEAFCGTFDRKKFYKGFPDIDKK